MREIIKKGKSTSKIISKFMEKHNVELDDFKFEVIEEGSKGFLNIFGQKPTKVKFIISDVADKIQEYAEGILQRMDVKYSSVKIQFIKNVYHVELLGIDNVGFIIGKEGKMLDSFQDLLNQMINKYEKRKLRVSVDVDNYRKRKKEALVDQVKSISGKVKKRGKSITLRPLRASKRKVVHKYVEKNSDLETMTVGQGKKKRIVIRPPKKNKRSKKSASRNS